VAGEALLTKGIWDVQKAAQPGGQARAVGGKMGAPFYPQPSPKLGTAVARMHFVKNPSAMVCESCAW
jgi:hypothetical protein